MMKRKNVTAHSNCAMGRGETGMREMGLESQKCEAEHCFGEPQMGQSPGRTSE